MARLRRSFLNARSDTWLRHAPTRAMSASRRTRAQIGAHLSPTAAAPAASARASAALSLSGSGAAAVRAGGRTARRQRSHAARRPASAAPSLDSRAQVAMNSLLWAASFGSGSAGPAAAAAAGSELCDGDLLCLRAPAAALQMRG
jgi:hypothetical protein